MITLRFDAGVVRFGGGLKDKADRACGFSGFPAKRSRQSASGKTPTRCGYGWKRGTEQGRSTAPALA